MKDFAPHDLAVADIVEVPLTRGMSAFVDAADWPAISMSSWHARIRKGGQTYAAACIKMKIVLMHRFLLPGVQRGMVIDHINGNGLDNRRSNLRVVSQAENVWNAIRPKSRNRTGFIGVSQDRGGYYGKVIANGVAHYTPRARTPLEAALARDELVKRLHGALNCLNFPDGEVQNASR